MLKFISGFILAIIITGCMYYFWLRTPSPETPPSSATPEKTNHAEFIYSLCKKLATHQADPLTAIELKQFKNSVKHLSYDQTIKALQLMEPPADEVRHASIITIGKPRDTSPESWEPPAELLASRLIELAPIHTSRWLQYSHIIPSLRWGLEWRGGLSFVKMFGQTHPELAWRETQLHYEKCWEIFDKEYRGNIPQMASGTFYSIALKDPHLAHKFLLEKSYQSKPYAQQLQSEALTGILRAIEHNPDGLIDLLTWLENDGFIMPDKMGSHSFRIHLSPFTNIDHMALALLARIDPQHAVQWAKEHDNPRIPQWQYAVYAGWVEFWPYKQSDIERYTTRWEDAMQWLVDHTRHPSDYSLIHNAYCRWNSHDRDAAIQWLNNDTHPEKLRQIKTELRKHHYIQEISQPQKPPQPTDS